MSSHNGNDSRPSQQFGTSQQLKQKRPFPSEYQLWFLSVYPGHQPVQERWPCVAGIKRGREHARKQGAREEEEKRNLPSTFFPLLAPANSHFSLPFKTSATQGRGNRDHKVPWEAYTKCTCSASFLTQHASARVHSEQIEEGECANPDLKKEKEKRYRIYSNKRPTSN